jgi:filamentous hemagglutinin family protein
MKNSYNYSSVFKIRSHGLVSLVVSGMLATTISYAAPASNALPTGGAVVSGNVNIASNAATMNINQASSKSIINWSTYNIGSAATVNYNFAQSGSSSLNRVLSNNPSEIYGRLNANGKVILVNPNGIVFGSGSSVNVGSIVATTMNIKDADYLDGKMVFTRDGSIGKVLNEGTITAEDRGYIALLAPEVVNNGVIKATMGTISLAAGDKVELTLDGSGLKTIIVEPSTIQTLIENKSLISAGGGNIYLGAKQASALLDTVMNLKNSGIIEATAMNSVDGKIVLDGDNIEVDGMLKATNIYAGNKNNAKTVVKSTATLEGEFVETSGKVLKVEDGVSVKAKTWLLDPAYVIIGARIPNQYYVDGLVETTIGASTIATSLNAGTDVLIESDDDIEVNENIITGAMANDATLKLKAGGDITVYNNVTIDATQNSNTKKLNIWMSLANTTGSRLAMNNSSSIKTNGGSFTVGGEIANGLPSIDGTASLAYGVSISDGVTIDAGVGNITLTAAGSGGAVSVDGATLKGANIYLKAYGANDAELKGTNIEATQNLEILGANVYMEGRDMEDADGNPMGYADTKLKADEISITSNALAADADTMEIYDVVINTNDKLTINAAAGVDFSGSQINFANTGGTLEINSFKASTRDGYIQAFMDDWGASSEAELLGLVNDDEGTNFATMNEYIANYKNTLPMLANLKGGTYKSKLFSDGAVSTVNTSTLPILNNGLLAFGNGLEGSVNEFGMLRQPLYYDQSAGRWYRLTYSNYPLAAIIGVGGDGTGEWNLNGTMVSTIEDGSSAFSNAVLNTSALSGGHGSIVAINTVTIDGQTLEMTNTYTLSSDKALIAMDTKLKNTSGSDMENVRLWVGAQDDWIATSDETTKERGNLANNSFVAIADSAERAKALMITGSSSGVLFRTTSEKSNVFSKEEYGSDFYTQDPSTSPVHIDESDGAYGVFTRFSNLTNSSNETIRWYYGAGSIADLSSLATAVSQQPSDSTSTSTGGATGESITTPSTPTQNTTVETIVSQIADNATKSVENSIKVTETVTPTTLTTNTQNQISTPSSVQVIGATSTVTGGVNGGAIEVKDGMTNISLAVSANANPFSGNTNISVLDGGVKLASAELPSNTGMEVKSDVKPSGIIGATPAATVVVKQFTSQKGVELAMVAPSNNVAESKVVAKIATDSANNFSFTVKEAVNLNVAQKDIKEVKATLDSGQALPSWLKFDVKTQTFKALNPPADALPISTKISITTKAGQTQQIAVEISK